MAIDDDSFYNITGEEISRTIIVQAMINFYHLLLQAGETRVTDFNEGSEIRNILETIAVANYAMRDEQNDLSMVAFLETSDGEWIDMHGAKPEIDQPRITGEYASGVVEFTLPENASVEIVIPEDTLLTCEDNGLDYITDNDAIIEAGTKTGSCLATCTVVGSDGNCEKETLNIISDDDLDINGLTVSNPEEFSGGMDYEEDDEYRERLLEYRQRNDFGSLPYYIDLCEAVKGVHDVAITEVEGYTGKVYVNGDTKPCPDTVLSEVLEEISLVSNIIWTHNFIVTKPSYKKIKFNITMSVYATIDNDELKGVLKDLIDGGASQPGIELDGLGIGEALTYDSFETILKLFDDVITITNCTYQVYNDGSYGSETDFITEITVNTTEVLQIDIDNCTITQNIIE